MVATSRFIQVIILSQEPNEFTDACDVIIRKLSKTKKREEKKFKQYVSWLSFEETRNGPR